MNIGVEQEHLFYAIHSGGDEFVVYEVLLKSLKKQGKARKHHHINSPTKPFVKVNKNQFIDLNYNKKIGNVLHK